MHNDCIYNFGDNFKIIESGKNNNITIIKSNGEILSIAPCPHPSIKHGVAWKAWTEYQDMKIITSLVSSWKVPSAPQNRGVQILYYWNGVEPTDNQAVLQPVLQFGSTPAGGGNYWALASWFVSASHGSFFSKLVRANTGNTIVGTLHSFSNGTWTVDGTVKESGQSSSFGYKPYSTDYSYAYEVLEAYNVEQNCYLYPTDNSLTFFDISVSAGGNVVTPKWVPKTQNNRCSETFTVNDPTSVKLTWRSH